MAARYAAWIVHTGTGLRHRLAMFANVAETMASSTARFSDPSGNVSRIQLEPSLSTFVSWSASQRRGAIDEQFRQNGRMNERRRPIRLVP